MSGPASIAQQRRIAGGRGALLTLADQVVSSSSNFVLGVLVARAGGADDLGSFGIAVLIWLTILGANRALISEPMTVVGSMNSGEAQLREGMFASLGLGTVVAGVVAGVLLITGIDAVTVLALVPWVPSLLVQDYWRGMAFRMQRPDHALINDIVFAVAQGSITVALFAFDLANVTAFLASWGIGATAGAVIGVRLARTRVSRGGGFAYLRYLWPHSRWFLAEFGTTFPCYQGYQLLLPALLGTAVFGTYRAGASLVGPALVIFLAAGNVGLPGCVRQLRNHGMSGLRAYTARLTGAVLALTIMYCAAVAILADPLLPWIYGHQFTSGAIVTQLLAIQVVVTATGLGCDIAVKAAGQMKQLWATRAVTSAVSIICVTVLPTLFGLTGAALVGVLSGVAYTVGVTIAYRQLCSRGRSKEAGDGAPCGVPPSSGSWCPPTSDAREAVHSADVEDGTLTSERLHRDTGRHVMNICNTKLPTPGRDEL